jgi:ATP-dependent DNA helicase RecG
MPLTEDELEELLSEQESSRVEKSSSFKDINKYSEAVCAFSNNLPNHTEDSYLILGVDDKTGQAVGAAVTDEILKNLGELRDSGNILPKPNINIEKVSLEDGDIVIITVSPHPFPPVRFKGRVCIRIGPRKGVATEAEERSLLEKRLSQAKTFDARPCLEASLDDLNIPLFKLSYLPRAIDSETLAENHREIKNQLASLRFYDLKLGYPTNASLLTLCDNVKYYIPGAYIQYVKYHGVSVDAEVFREREFVGDLITVMSELDLFIKDLVETKPVSHTSLSEKLIHSYPSRAIRELLNNAIMHRDYESNAPIGFYEFLDRIEIVNPGGLYGAATASNFPHQNDYRNPVLAEVLKILGYVNKFNRGIITAKNELNLNGNPDAKFSYDQPNHFGVTIYKKL